MEGMEAVLGGAYGHPAPEQQQEEQGQPEPWLPGFATLPLPLPLPAGAGSAGADADGGTRASLVDGSFLEAQWAAQMWDEVGSSSEATDQDDAEFALQIGSVSPSTDQDDAGVALQVGSVSPSPGLGELGGPPVAWGDRAWVGEQSADGYAMLWDDVASSSEATDQEDIEHGFDEVGLAGPVATQNPTAWMQTQNKLEWTHAETKGTPAPVAYAVVPAADRKGSRAKQRAGCGAAPQSEDGEALQPATARHLPRHHPLVGLAGKIQSVVDAPLVCPMCSRHCEGHQRLGFHWGKFGYDGPPYCSRCSSVFRAHMVTRTVSASKCSRQNPCAQCVVVLAHFHNSREEAFAAMDEAARKTQTQLRDSANVKIQNGAASSAEDAEAREEAVVQCPHCREEGSRKSMGMFWRKFGYSGAPYCQNCSAQFRNHIIRQRSKPMQDCARDCPCKICGDILNSFEDPSSEGRKRTFELIDSKRHRQAKVAGNHAVDVGMKREPAGIDMETTVNPSAAKRSIDNKKRKLSNCGGGVSVPLPLAFVGLLSVVTLALLGSTGHLPGYTADDSTHSADDALPQSDPSGQTSDESVQAFVCTGSQQDPAFPDIPIDSHCRGAIGSTCEFRCQLDWLAVGNRTCIATGVGTGVYQGGTCRFHPKFPIDPFYRGDPDPHVLSPIVIVAHRWALVCNSWQWTCVDDPSKLPTSAAPGYRTWPRRFSADSDSNGEDDPGKCAYVCAQYGKPRDSELRAFCPQEYSRCFADQSMVHSDNGQGNASRACDQATREIRPSLRMSPPPASCATQFDCAVLADEAPVTGTLSEEYLELLQCALGYPTKPAVSEF